MGEAIETSLGHRRARREGSFAKVVNTLHMEEERGPSCVPKAAGRGGWVSAPREHLIEPRQLSPGVGRMWALKSDSYLENLQVVSSDVSVAK